MHTYMNTFFWETKELLLSYGPFFNCGSKPEVLQCSHHFLVPSMKAQSSYSFNQTETTLTIHLNRLSQAQTGLLMGICWINDTLAIKHLSVFTDNKTTSGNYGWSLFWGLMSLWSQMVWGHHLRRRKIVFLLQDSPEPSMCSKHTSRKSHLSRDVSKQ